MNKIKGIFIIFLALISQVKSQVAPVAPQPLPTIEHVNGNNYSFSWEGLPNRVYFIQVSSQPSSINGFAWEFVPDIRMGTGNTLSMGFEANSANSEFFRVMYVDYYGAEDVNLADFNQDGLTNLENVTQNINPVETQGSTGGDGDGTNGDGNGNDDDDDDNEPEHEWEYQLTLEIDEAETDYLVNPDNRNPFLTYALGEDTTTRLTFLDQIEINRAIYINVQPNEDHDPAEPEEPDNPEYDILGVVRLSAQNPTWEFEAPTGSRSLGLLQPVEVMELAPRLRDLTTDEEIVGSEIPDLIADHTNPMVEVNPVQNRIAHREIRIRIGDGTVFSGKEVTWSMAPLFVPPAVNPPAQEDPVFRGDWADSQTHPDRFETSTTYGAHEFHRISQQQGRTEVNVEGYTAIRMNLPPVGFNKARITIHIEDVPDAIDIIDMEVPAIIVIDPGHGGTQNREGSNWNNATSPTGVLEKNMTLEYARELRDSIELHAEQEDLHIRVRMTRDADVNYTGAERANVARDVGADIFHSFHFNATNGAARGSESLTRGTANVNANEDDALGRRVLDGVLAGIRQFDNAGARDRGVKDFAWSGALQRNVPSQWAVLSDPSYENVAAYHPIRGIISEVEFIDVPAVDVLLNTGPNAANVRTAIADEVRDAIIEDINHQP